MTAVKIYFNDETRRLQLDDSELNFKSLFKTIENIFPFLNGNFCIKWKDEEVVWGYIFLFLYLT